jgi:hypothetical protein
MDKMQWLSALLACLLLCLRPDLARVQKPAECPLRLFSTTPLEQDHCLKWVEAVWKHHVGKVGSFEEALHAVPVIPVRLRVR